MAARRAVCPLRARGSNSEGWVLVLRLLLAHSDCWVLIKSSSQDSSSFAVSYDRFLSIFPLNGPSFPIFYLSSLSFISFSPSNCARSKNLSLSPIQLGHFYIFSFFAPIQPPTACSLPTSFHNLPRTTTLIDDPMFIIRLATAAAALVSMVNAPASLRAFFTRLRNAFMSTLNKIHHTSSHTPS